jgi:hypothetical protein
MGGMGGGMGGMGGGMMGGMGGMGGGMMGGMGMMSVPPAEKFVADVDPGQSRTMATRLVSLDQPDDEGHAVLAKRGEKLQLGDISQFKDNPRVQAALRRLSEAVAPQTVTQLVLWNVAYGIDWPTLARISRSWANPQELALARHFVETLDQGKPARAGLAAEAGTIDFEILSQGADQKALADELRALLDGKLVLGLKARIGAPEQPEGPAIRCGIKLAGTQAKPEAIVFVSVSDPDGATWVPKGKFTLPLTRGDSGVLKATDVALAMGEGLLGRLVRTQLSPGPRVKGKASYKLRVDNASPMVLNGLAFAGTQGEAAQKVSVLAGFALSPQRSMTVPVSAEAVEGLGLKNGVRLVAADLSGL